MAVANAVEFRQKFEFEANTLAACRLRIRRRINLFPVRPANAAAAQRPGCTNERKEVPATAPVRIAVRIGIQEIAPEKKAVDLIVKTERVVADAHGPGLIEA